MESQSQMRVHIYDEVPFKWHVKNSNLLKTLTLVNCLIVVWSFIIVGL